MSIFHLLEVVCCGSETQLQVGENLNYLIQRFEGIGIFSRKIFGFTITPEAIVGPIIMLGARWVVKSIKFTKFYI